MACPLPSPLQLPLAFGLGAAVLDGILPCLWRGLPLYRRHLGLVGAGCLLALGTSAPLLAVAGTFLGLSLPSLRWLRGRGLAGLSWRRGEARRSDPHRPLILVADPHWGEVLTGLEEATARHPEADWLFLGDLFEVWIGLSRLTEPNQTAFLAWVDARRAAGRWVGLWAGNREFFLEGLSSRFDLLGEGIGGCLPEEGLAWEHGDLLDGRLCAYRLMAILFRSGPTWLFVRFAPVRIARAAATSLRRRFAARPGPYLAPVPLEALEAAGRASHAKAFVVGHFHHEARTGIATALPWAHEGRFWVWAAGELRPLEDSTRP